MPHRRGARGFTLIELLVVVATIGLLISILLPALAGARRQSKSTVCKTRLRVLGQGIALYATQYHDKLLPSRMPKLDNHHWQVRIAGGLKYRPTFLAMMGEQVGIPPFTDPQPSKTTVDREGEPGDQQNYASDAYVCPEAADWTDERNACYGYNYQFLGNARLKDPDDVRSFKNWPRAYSLIGAPASTVAVGDSLGTAAVFGTRERLDYDNNARAVSAKGNEGFNLDPPAVDPERGEIAEQATSEGGPARTAVDERHAGAANILWLDGHVSGETLESLGYTSAEDGAVGLTGSNRQWSGDQREIVWIQR